ncbi:DUF4910 domain-containing protein [candidate division KSB1 bacterium]
MKIKEISLVLIFLSTLITSERVQAQLSPFFSDQVVNNIINEISGEKALHNVIMLAPYERNRQEKEYTGIFWESEYTLEKLKEYGFADAQVERWDVSAEEWDCVKGELWMLEPEMKKIIDYDDINACIAMGSSSADVTAELIDVNVGDSNKDYEGKDVKGKIVFGSGSIGRVYNRAVIQRGAAGVVVYNSISSAVDYPNQIMWTSIPKTSGVPRDPTQPRAESFGIQLTGRQGYELKKVLRNRKVVVHADIKVAYYPEKIEVPTAIIPGNGDTDQEIIFMAHLFDHIPKQGANDNISGSAALLEIGRTIIKLLQENKIPPLRRSIRFIWMPEIIGTQAYVKRYQSEINKLIGGINMDMVGENLALCNSIFRIAQTPYSLPSYINALFRHSGNFTVNLGDKLFTPTGTRDLFHFRFTQYMGGLDGLVFNDSYVKVPTLYLGCFPDNFYHSSADSPDKFDPTMLKRAVFIGVYGGLIIGCAQPEDAVKIINEVYGLSKENIANEMIRAVAMLNNATPEKLSQVFHFTDILIKEAYKRESASILSTEVFTEARSDIKNYISKMIDNFNADEKNTLKYIQNHYEFLCNSKNIERKEYVQTEYEKKLADIIPVKTASRDRILENIFGRPQYKFFRQWRVEYEEILNFIDGRRSILDIATLLQIELDRFFIQYVETISMPVKKFDTAFLKDVERYINILKENNYIDFK